MFSVYSIIVVLLFLLTVTWFGNSRVRHTRSLFPGSRIGADSKIPYASRIAAWEDTWLSEEEALWEWLQDRTGLAEGFSFPVPSSSGHESRVTPGSTSFSTRSRKRSTNNRDLQWAIKITEDRLALLKQKSGSSQNIKGTPKQSYPPIAHDSVQLTEQEANDVESLLNQVVGSR